MTDYGNVYHQSRGTDCSLASINLIKILQSNPSSMDFNRSYAITLRRNMSYQLLRFKSHILEQISYFDVDQIVACLIGMKPYHVLLFEDNCEDKHVCGFILFRKHSRRHSVNYEGPIFLTRDILCEISLYSAPFKYQLRYSIASFVGID